MNANFTRRDFLAASAAAGAGALVAGQLPGAEFKTKLYKAMIGKPQEKYLTELKEAGFDGIESDDRGATPEQAAKAKQLADKLGLKIHSMLYGWANFNSKDEGQVAKDLASIEHSLRACQAYEATALLLVPCRLDLMRAGPVPQPWDFDIEFDEKTGHLKRAVAGDNAKYAGYIKAHNEATDMSRTAVEKLIPTAEKCGVVIALENVWNNLWVKPALLANFVKSFNNRWVQCYFDIGNHVKYAPPEEWIRALGSSIVKLHVKDFTVDRKKPYGGQMAHPREGDVNWPSVRQELDKIGYNGFLTIEDDRLPLKEFSHRLDLIIAGK